MKRIRYACLEQTLHFGLKDDIPHEDALRLVEAELERYKHQLERGGAKYEIVSQRREADGSIVLEIKKQYLQHDTGNYMA